MTKSRTHRHGRASGSDRSRNRNARSNKSHTGASAGPLRPLPHQASSSSEHSRRSQRVDLVVEDHEAEEEDRVQAQRERGSAWAADTRHFAYVCNSHPSPAGTVGLTHVSPKFRRPSGQPIQEESAPVAPTRSGPPEEQEVERSSTPWTYSALEEDNVWSK